ncbi:MAG: Phosphoserine phosphatase [Candidatus Marinimicrobia bacterium]|nr:Phosphoserine phosphatase [Candidatus Neomarinimicrobiota bacterium]
MKSTNWLFGRKTGAAREKNAFISYCRKFFAKEIEWQLQFVRTENKFSGFMNATQFQSIIFDCDSTLTALEGVDYLAELHDVHDAVADLTSKAMNTFSITPEMYEKRLELIQPRRDDLATLAQAYKNALVPGVEKTIATLRNLGKTLYIISGGIRKAILPVGDYLGIPAERIHAVDVYFNLDGDYIGFDRDSVLVSPNGKSQIIRNIGPDKPMAFIGDGTNDLAAQDMVDQFIGFGGAEYRPPIEDAAPLYVKDPDFQALLPHILTADELESVTH